MTDLRQDSMTGEQWVFDERSDDPATHLEGERWIRTDLTPKTNQIATLRADVGAAVVDVPVFSIGTSEAGVDEALRVKADGEVGYLPITVPADAAYPNLRMQHNGSTLAYHNRVAPGPGIPDSGVSRWTFDNGDTDGATAIDVWGGNDATIYGATTGVSGANQTYQTNEAYSFDGDDRLVSEGFHSTIADYSFAVWANPESYFDYQDIFGVYSNSGALIRLRINPNNDSYENTITNSSTGNDLTLTGPSASFGNWEHICATYDGSSLKMYIDGSEVASGSLSADTLGDAEFAEFSEFNKESIYYYSGEMDDARFYSKALSSTEVSNLYNTGSISG